jgi:hypothetical protein
MEGQMIVRCSNTSIRHRSGKSFKESEVRGMDEETAQKIEETVLSLCEWIQKAVKKDTPSGKELDILPGVIQATSNLMMNAPTGRMHWSSKKD